MAFRMPNRELSVTEILSKSLGLYSERFMCFLVPSLFSNLANGALWQVMGFFLPSFSLPENYTDEFFLWLVNYLAVAIPIFAFFALIGWVISVLSNGITVRCSADRLEGRHVDLKQAVSFTLTNLSSLLAAGFITAVLTLLGLIFFIVPGVIVTVMFGLVVQVVIIERLNASESLRRSRKLVAHRWGKTFMVLLSVLLITLATYVIGDFIGELVVGSSIASLSFLKWLIISIVSSLGQPLQPIALTFLYYSMRTREKPPALGVPPQPIVSVTPPTRLPAQSYPSFQPMFCFKCGQRLPSDTVYCPWCGVRVRS